MSDLFPGKPRFSKGIAYPGGVGGPDSAVATGVVWALQSNFVTSATEAALGSAANLYHVDQKLKALINDLRALKIIKGS